jgi:hypothetical protein
MDEVDEHTLSQLQQKILRLICTMNNVSYKTLMEKTNRDRVTILQSIESLIKYNYIQKQKINPEYEKSKLIFKPTHLGKHVAWIDLDIPLEDIMKIEGDEEIVNYLEFIKDIRDPSQRKVLIDPLSTILTSLAAWTSKGRLEPNQKTNIIKEGLKKGLLELVQNKNYDAKNLLNERSISWLKKLFTPQQIREIRDFILQVRDNLTRTNERFLI